MAYSHRFNYLFFGKIVFTMSIKIKLMPAEARTNIFSFEVYPNPGVYFNPDDNGLYMVHNYVVTNLAFIYDTTFIGFVCMAGEE